MYISIYEAYNHRVVLSLSVRPVEVAVRRVNVNECPRDRGQEMSQLPTVFKNIIIASLGL